MPRGQKEPELTPPARRRHGAARLLPLSAVSPPVSLASWTSSQKRLGFLDLRSLGVSVLSERREFLEITARLGGVAGGFRRLRRTVKPPQPVRRRVQRSLVRLHCQGRLTGFEQQVAQHLAHWVESVLHRDVLLGRVFEVGGCPHELQGVVVPSFSARVPAAGSEDENVNLLAPVAVFRRLAQRLQLADFLFYQLRLAELGSAGRADEAWDRLGVGKGVSPDRKGERFGPRSAFQHIAGGRSGLSRVSSVGPPSA